MHGEVTIALWRANNREVARVICSESLSFAAGALSLAGATVREVLEIVCPRSLQQSARRKPAQLAVRQLQGRRFAFSQP